MNWVTINNQQAALKEYHLMQNDDYEMLLKYNPQQHSARFSCGGKHHRLFYFETSGQLSSKTIFTDQYGMETGNIVKDKIYGHGGTVLLDGKKLHYNLQDSPVPRLVIYESDPARPMVSCSITKGNDAALINCFITGICWYIFLQVAKEMPVEYAA